MLFVRNPTGVSHSPEEHAETADCLAGVEALADVLADLAGARDRLLAGARLAAGDVRWSVRSGVHARVEDGRFTVVEPDVDASTSRPPYALPG